MKKFRVVRASTHGTRTFSFGTTYDAETARDAVRRDNQAVNSRDSTMGGLLHPITPAPVVRVYELTLVPESEWK